MGRSVTKLPPNSAAGDSGRYFVRPPPGRRRPGHYSHFGLTSELAVTQAQPACRLESQLRNLLLNPPRENAPGHFGLCAAGVRICSRVSRNGRHESTESDIGHLPSSI